MQQYILSRIADRVHLDALYDAAFWAAIPAAGVDVFPWYQSGVRQKTSVRLACDSERIIAEFVCEDAHITSRIIELNGPVWTDSCVELFVRPDPDHSRSYFNVEINACGTLLMAWGPDRHKRQYIDFDGAKDVKIFHSQEGMLKSELPGDLGWRIVAPIPFHVFNRLSGLKLSPQPGTRWTGNFYRCGGASDPQHACWSPIDLPVPDFHCPDYFGDLIFG